MKFQLSWKAIAGYMTRPINIFELYVFQKPGKWCAAHVRIAWEIYHHQQKTSDKGPGDNKMADPLRPPGHLLPGSMIQRGPDYPNSASTSGLGEIIRFTVQVDSLFHLISH